MTEVYLRDKENDVAECNPVHNVKVKHVGSNLVIPMGDFYEFYSMLKNNQWDGSIVDFIENEIPNIKSAFQKRAHNAPAQFECYRRFLEGDVFMGHKGTIQQLMYGEIQFGIAYRIEEIKRIMEVVYADLDIYKKPTLKDLKTMFRLKFSPCKQYVKILDFKWSN